MDRRSADHRSYSRRQKSVDAEGHLSYGRSLVSVIRHRVCGNGILGSTGHQHCDAACRAMPACKCSRPYAGDDFLHPGHRLQDFRPPPEKRRSGDHSRNLDLRFIGRPAERIAQFGSSVARPGIGFALSRTVQSASDLASRREVAGMAKRTSSAPRCTSCSSANAASSQHPELYRVWWADRCTTISDLRTQSIEVRQDLQTRRPSRIPPPQRRPQGRIPGEHRTPLKQILLGRVEQIEGPYHRGLRV